LAGDVDFRAVALVPKEYTLKGMFFARLVRLVEGLMGTKAMLAMLAEPPRFGRYLPFADYPVADYFRLFDKAARHLFADVSPRESYRRLARTDVETFMASTLGRVVANLLPDPKVALLKYEEVYGLLVKGPSIRAFDAGEKLVRFELEGPVAFPEYPVGLFEGIVQTLGFQPRVEVGRRDGLDVAHELGTATPPTPEPTGSAMSTMPTMPTMPTMSLLPSRRGNSPRFPVSTFHVSWS
jgi:uncharacterized protein (TIGR02265 family)